MAAPPAKPSPSNKEVQRTSEENESPVEAAKAAAAATPEPATADATSAEAVALTPKEADDEANAAATINIPTYDSSETSEHYALAKQFLTAGDFEQALATIEQGIEESKAVLASLNVEFDFHECMAPFHYLYGTTLLYSIEESNDTQMTVGDAAAASGQSADSESDPAFAPTASNNPAEANVDDMEIAWENLEAARNILDALLAQDMTQERKAKLQADLAQTLLREGDLQRLNGRYTEAIHDYEASLQLRKLVLPRFDRKIADTQYNLGLSYLSNSSEMQKEEVVDAARQKLSQQHCQQGIQLYLDCAKTMCGQIALRCGVEPESVLKLDGSGKAGLKTTGMAQEAVTQSEVSNTLATLRRNVADLTPAEAGDYTVDDLRQLLDEIQETVDEAQSSQEAVRQAAEIKQQAKQAVDVSDAATGATTSIGFDKPTLQPDSKPEAQPMMVVKKKKKRDVPPADEDAKPEEKRPKAE